MIRYGKSKDEKKLKFQIEVIEDTPGDQALESFNAKCAGFLSQNATKTVTLSSDPKAGQLLIEVEIEPAEVEAPQAVPSADVQNEETEPQ